MNCRRVRCTCRKDMGLFTAEEHGLLWRTCRKTPMRFWRTAGSIRKDWNVLKICAADGMSVPMKMWEEGLTLNCPQERSMIRTPGQRLRIRILSNISCLKEGVDSVFILPLPLFCFTGCADIRPGMRKATQSRHLLFLRTETAATRHG